MAQIIEKSRGLLGVFDRIHNLTRYVALGKAAEAAGLVVSHEVLGRSEIVDDSLDDLETQRVRSFGITHRIRLSSAFVDTLTKAYNRKYYERKIDGIIEGTRESTVFVMCDIDNFGLINKEYGWDVGDAVLEMVAKTMQLSIRSAKKIKKPVSSKEHTVAKDAEIDHFMRMGGEEFLFAFPNTSTEEIIPKLEELREKISQLRDCVPVTVSMGVCEFRPENHIGESSATISKKIWTAVGEQTKKAKESGKNRIVSNTGYETPATKTAVKEMKQPDRRAGALV